MEKFICDRRQLLKILTTAAVTAKIVDFQKTYALSPLATDCRVVSDNQGIPPTGTEMDVDKGKFFYWLDGSIGGATGGLTAALPVRLSIAIDAMQTTASYVEMVALTDSLGNIIQSQRFTSSDKTRAGKVPYVVFNSLHLEAKDPGYFIYYIVNNGGNGVIYRYALQANMIRTSRFDYAHLYADALNTIPSILISDIQNGKHSFNNNTPAGFAYTTSATQGFFIDKKHQIRFNFKNVSSNGAFTARIVGMHPDVSNSHFMRWFLITDPVGRPLGGIRRSFGDTQFLKMVTSGGEQGVEFGNYFDTNETSLMASKTTLDNYCKQQNILDCPHVNLYIDDVENALAVRSFLLF